MSEIIKAIILGIIQGATEFLPISSSGHLELAKYFLNFSNLDNSLFVLELHIATALSTILFYRKDLFNLTKTSLLRTEEGNQTREFIYLIGIASLPVLILALIVGDDVDSLFSENLITVGIGFLTTTLMLLSTKWSQKLNLKERPIDTKLALIIGIAQAVSVVPSISRSAATICIALIFGADKKEAVKFSFLMGLVPIIGGNLIYIVNGKISFDQLGSISLISGSIAAFIFGLISIPVVKKLSANNKLYYFAIYTGILGIVSLVIGIF